MGVTMESQHYTADFLYREENFYGRIRYKYAQPD